jgi:hypothetical protein
MVLEKETIQTHFKLLHFLNKIQVQNVSLDSYPVRITTSLLDN